MTRKIITGTLVAAAILVPPLAQAKISLKSVNVTLPVGMLEVLPVLVSVTVAVMVSGCPTPGIVTLVVTATAVVSPALMPVPLTLIVCVEPATFSMLSVTVTLSLRLPEVCGVNSMATSQELAGARLALLEHRLVSVVSSEKSAGKAGLAPNIRF